MNITGKVDIPETGNIKAGFDDDGDYFNIVEKIILCNLSAVPFDIGDIDDMEEFRYMTLLFLVRERNLRMISIWHPSFLSLLFEKIPEYLPKICEDIRSGTKHKRLKASKKRAKELEQIHKTANPLQEILLQIWPDLALISCWTDAASKQAAERLAELLPDVEIQGKGLMATEGFVSFPYYSKGNILSINSHFYEFIDIESQEIVLVQELQKGKEYEVIITTSGGLYRYRMHDIVKLNDFIDSVPVLEFIGKNDYVSDLAGEKINAVFVKNAIERIFDRLPDFAMLAPEQKAGEMHYALFISGRADLALDVKLEAELLKNYNYAYCRKLNQLSHVKVIEIPADINPMEIYNNRKLVAGLKQGNIKFSYLEKSLNWSKTFYCSIHCCTSGNALIACYNSKTSIVCMFVMAFLFMVTL